MKDWAQLLREATDLFAEAEKVQGRTVAERTKAAYQKRNMARTKVSNTMYHMQRIIKETEDAASEDN